jgi:predicted AlkP superfamily pyrophosphatase or phosphodiesterase
VHGFADLPARIEALTREHERVALILLDAFGMKFVERHASHPLLKRLEIEPLASQFPSTTTAHLTTLYTGLPVTEHGLYEWKCFEPLLEDVIVPLRFVRWNGDALDIDPRDVVPSPSLFEQLAVPCTVLQPAHLFPPSKYSSVAQAGAKVVPFDDVGEGVAQLGAPGFSYLYWDAIDAAGHVHGPSSPEFDAAALHALDAIEASLPKDTLLLITADHGQIDVEHLDFLDDLWPELRLRHPPAGSARDCFLHVDEPERVRDELATRLGDRAEVRLARDLFDTIGPRLEQRIGDVCVLPAPGRMAWLREFPSHERRFRGHHGGLTAAESQTWLGVAST